MRFATTVLLTSFFWISAAYAESEIYTIERLNKEGWEISAPISASEVEAKSLREMEIARKTNPDVPLVPFGYQQSKWEGFKKLLKKDEKLIFISSPKSYWKKLRGTEGYAIIRNNKVAYYFRTFVN